MVGLDCSSGSFLLEQRCVQGKANSISKHSKDLPRTAPHPWAWEISGLGKPASENSVVQIGLRLVTFPLVTEYLIKSDSRKGRFPRVQSGKSWRQECLTTASTVGNEINSGAQLCFSFQS